MKLGELFVFDFLPEGWRQPVAALIILALSLVVGSLVRRLVRDRIKPHTRNPLAADFLGQLMGSIVILIGVLLMLRQLGYGNVTATLLAGAGIITLVVGFAFKDIGENFLAGILLAMKSPFRINDMIETGGITGRVRELNLRETLVKTSDGKDVFIPNGQILKNPLVNFTLDGFMRQEFTVGIGYGSPLPEVASAIEKLVQTVPGVLDGARAPSVIIDKAATSSVELKVFFWVNTTGGGAGRRPAQVRSDAIAATIEHLMAQGIELPADIVEVRQLDR